MFVDEYSGILGFPVVHDDLQCDASAQSKLKLKQEPEIDELLERLESGGGPNLCDWGNAKKLFKALNKRALGNVIMFTSWRKLMIWAKRIYTVPLR